MAKFTSFLDNFLNNLVQILHPAGIKNYAKINEKLLKLFHK